MTSGPSTPAIELVALSGPDAERRWESGCEPFTIGRARGNTIQLRDESASKRHARIEWRDDAYTIEDAGSRNGTAVDGVPVMSAAALSHGALIAVGNTILRVSLPGASTEALGASIAETIVQGAQPGGPNAATLERVDRGLGQMVAIVRAANSTAHADEPTRETRLATALRDAVDADHVAYVQLSADRSDVKIAAEAAQTDADPSTKVISRSIIKQVRSTGDPLLCQDVLETESPAAHADNGLSAAGADTASANRRSVICVPLPQDGGDVSAVMHIVRGPRRPRFDALDLRVIQSLAQLHSIAKTATPRAFAGAATLSEAPDASTLIYRSKAMQSVVTIVRRAAASSATILLHGESGTGKEVLARLIHQWSPRADQPLIRVNCASIQETLAESELFGHERGAFTSAVRQHRGRFEQAHQGTLLLDEIAELSAGCQAKLLRVLEDRVIERVGGERSIEVDVRLIASTHQDLRKAAADGEFRSDLLHRIAVLPIQIPTLRERRDDIPPLVEHFVAQLARQHLHGTPSVEPAALELLHRFDWPGNVRQLRNVIEQALIHQAGDPLDRASIAAALEFHAATTNQQADVGDLPLEDARNAFETQYVQRVLEACNWNRSQAARTLGIARQNLIQKLKKLGIEPPAQ